MTDRRDEHAAALAVLEAAALQAAARGSLLFHLDLATELARPLLADAPDLLIATVLENHGYGVEAIDPGPSPVIRASVRFAADGRPLPTRPLRAAPPAVEALARARVTLADARLTGGDAEALLPIPPRGEDSDTLEGYAIAIADNRGDVVLGVHWHATLSCDGRELIAARPLSRSALVLPGRGDLPPLSAQVTHFGAVPSEIHTYLSLKHGLPLEVIALESNLGWRVDGERTTRAGAIASN